MSIEKDIKKLYKLKLGSVWNVTFDEGEENELILKPNYVGFEIGSKVLNILGNDDGKLEITVDDTAKYVLYDEEDIDYKIDVRSLILTYPEDDYYITEIRAVKADFGSEKLLCDAVEINAVTENYGNQTQTIFIHSGIYGLRIGGSEMKKYWVKNWYMQIYGEELDEYVLF